MVLARAFGCSFVATQHRTTSVSCVASLLHFTAAFADERARYADALGSTGDPALAAELRDAARRVAALVPA